MGSHRITALWVEAESVATADFLNVRTEGKCTFAGLTVDGQFVNITGQPNQTITFPDGYLIINEQTGLNSQHFGSLTVNALHLQVDGVGSFTAASSTAEIAAAMANWANRSRCRASLTPNRAAASQSWT